MHASSTSYLPLYHRSIPWPLKFICTSSVLFSNLESFKVTHLHIFGPWLLALFLVLCFYPYKIIFSMGGQQKNFLSHVICMVFALLAYGNCILFVIQVDVSVALVCSVLVSEHFLYHTRVSLEQTRDLYDTQSIMIVFCKVLEIFIPIMSWFVFPKTNPTYKSLSLVFFAPELLGCLISLVFRMDLFSNFQ